MTLEAALKRLAEKEPKKFKLIAEDENLGLEYGTKADWRLVWFNQGDGLTQDDIDEILALIGWTYEVWTKPTMTTHTWKFTIYNDLGSDVDWSKGTSVYTSKLEAAKNALVAVVEKQYS